MADHGLQRNGAPGASVQPPVIGGLRTTLGELVKDGAGFIQTGPFGSQLHARDYVEAGTPVVMPQQLGNNEIRTEGIARIGDEDRDRLRRHVMREGDIVFSRRGDVTRRAYISEHESGWLCGTGCLLLRLDHPRCDNRYLARFLGLHEARSHLTQRAIGATMPNLNQSILASLPVTLPSLARQERVVAILTKYDELMRNNRRRMQLLERAARLLYEEWFERFQFAGSTSARDGRDPPSGWCWRTLGDILLKIESGNRPRGGSVSRGLPSVGAENVMGIGQYDYRKEKYVPDEYFRAMRRGVVVDRDVLVYKDGAQIGRSSYFGDGFPHAKCAVNEHVFLVRAIPEVGQNLLYFWFASEDNRQRIRNLNANTAQPGVSRSKLKTLPFLKPPVAIVRAFDRAVEPAVRQIFGLAKQQRTLVAARDAMLPRLMNGEIAA